ncbi:class I SAM-dependent methyltransferase [Pseudooceanicola aestuarii]|uniref:class I SAM-dependent methyltransferase n=1 Tax=Pseudooceanicola aestuarii TaxID=2697319 RepID=UPI0013D7530F|nr:class I SAM-dependent methyltransferase [Pseudooceanicola aestuarii]
MSEISQQIIPLYRRHGLDWNRLRSRALVERDWLAAFVAALPARAAVLDLGCGAGDPLARALLARGARVTGVDTSAPLLRLARQRMPAAHWHLGDMRRLAMGRRFHGILAWDSLFHLAPADQRRLMARIAAHAAPGAALMFTSGPRAGVALGRFRGAPLYHASLSPEETRRLLARHGFALLRHGEEDPACGGRTVWLARRVGPIAARQGPGARVPG